MIERIQWLGHGSFFLPGPPLIYINPWRVARNVFHADVILITHDHFEHFSVADIEKLRGPETIIIANEKVASQIEGCTIIRPWQSLTIDRAAIKAVPAYSPEDWRHPLSDGGLGFVISMHYYDIYYTGDTKIIPEMDNMRPDVLILPIDGNGTMTPTEAAHLVKMLRPRWAIPCNWGHHSAEGASHLDALTFKRLAEGVTEILLMEEH